MEIFTDELILRTVTESDIDEIVRMWNYPNEETLENAYQALEYMQQTHKKNRPKAICHLCLAIFHKKEPKRIIGWCGLDGEAENGKTVLFYCIDKELRNRGYATQCVKELLKYAFVDMEYDVVYGGCEKENHESYRVMQKAGMIQKTSIKTAILFLYRQRSLCTSSYQLLRKSDYMKRCCQRKKEC